MRRIIENSRISTGGDHYYGSDIAGMHYVRMSVFGPGFPENSEVPNPDSDGRVWVSVYTAAKRRDIPPRPAGNPTPVLSWRQRLTFDVFDKAGAYLGRIALKPNAQMLDAQGDRLFVLERGVDDVEFVVCYRISGAAR